MRKKKGGRKWREREVVFEWIKEKERGCV